VVGLLVNIFKGDDPGLLALESDRQTLTLNGRNWRHEILQSTAPIDRVAVSHTAPNIAYSTVSGEIVVYSLQHRANLCRYEQGKPV
jgi:hypothetical protein